MGKDIYPEEQYKKLSQRIWESQQQNPIMGKKKKLKHIIYKKGMETYRQSSCEWKKDKGPVEIILVHYRAPETQIRAHCSSKKYHTF